MVKRSKIRLKNEVYNVLKEVTEKPKFSSQEYKVHDGRGIFHARDYALKICPIVEKCPKQVIFIGLFPALHCPHSLLGLATKSEEIPQLGIFCYEKSSELLLDKPIIRGRPTKQSGDV